MTQENIQEFEDNENVAKSSKEKKSKNKKKF